MNYKRKIAIQAVIAVMVIALLASASPGAVTVDLTMGKATVLTLEQPSKRVSLADPDVVELTLISPSELLLSGKRPGTTNLIVWDAKERATIYDLVVSGDTAMLMGQIKEVAPGDDVRVEAMDQTITLKGSVKTQETMDWVVKVAQAYSPKVMNFLRVSEPPQILLEVRVAQIDRTKLGEFGLGLLAKGSDAEGTGTGLIGNPTGSVTGAAGGIGGFPLTTEPQFAVSYFPEGIAGILKALSTNGLAKVLAEPNLVVRSGETGSFHAGARIPTQQVTGTPPTPSIVYENVGIRVNFTPQVLDSGTIRLNINPAEVSSLGQKLEFAGGLVAFQIDTRTVSTNVDLKEGESLILAGLLSEEMKKNLKKVPLLGDIPILGVLFRSSSDELKKTELAFFITPRMVKPFAPGEKVTLPGETLTPKEERKYWWIPVPGGSDKPKGEEEAAEEEEYEGMQGEEAPMAAEEAPKTPEGEQK